MAEPIVIPRLGLTMEYGRLVDWLVPDGEIVKKGEPLFSVETDKVVMEVEAPANGIVHHRPHVSAEMLPIGTLIGYIAQPGEAVNWPENEESDAQTQLEYNDESVAEIAARPTISREKRASPAARRRALELGIDWHTLTGSSQEGHVILADVEAAISQSASSGTWRDKKEPEVLISPVARRAAAELDVDIEALAAQFPGKRLRREDIEQAADQGLDQRTGEKRTPAPHMRRIIAERMLASSQTTAPVTLTTEADATELVRLRKQIKSDQVASGRRIPSYNDLFIKLVAQALLEHPSLNARLEGADIVTFSAVHIGIAADTERGLLTPVLTDVQAKSLQQISEESIRLIERARSGRLQPDDLHNGTFTITNLGMFDIDAFTPIINMPETAILGLGRIVPKQVVVDLDAEEVAIRNMMFLSLTFDHRLVDGAPAARFLQRVKQFVEKPYLWLTI